MLPNANLELLVIQLLVDNPALQRRMFELAGRRVLEGQASAAHLPQFNVSLDRERVGAPACKASGQYRARLEASW